MRDGMIETTSAIHVNIDPIPIKTSEKRIPMKRLSNRLAFSALVLSRPTQERFSNPKITGTENSRSIACKLYRTLSSLILPSEKYCLTIIT